MNLEKRNINTRDNTIDVMKGTLTVLMIIAHIIQLIIIIGDNSILNYISIYVNLTTFSGFLFCNGYVCYMAYLRKSKTAVKQKLIVGIKKMLIAFYISGFSYMFFFGGKFSIKEIVKILTLTYAPGYSEFLLSFAVVYIILLLFFNQINMCINNKKIFIGASIFSLISTFLSGFNIKLPLIGSVIGTTYYCAFPIMAYFSYFLAGAYLSKNKVIFSKKIFLVCLIGTTSFLGYFMLNRNLPSRFPVSLLWVVGGYIFVYTYFIFFKKIKSKISLRLLKYIGENTLIALVVSNIVIFSVHYIDSKNIIISQTNAYTLGIIVFAVIVLAIIVYVKLLNKIKNNIILK